jgi:hypothetical protein
LLSFSLCCGGKYGFVLFLFLFLFKRASISPTTPVILCLRREEVWGFGGREGRIIIDKVGVKKMELIGEGVINFGESEEGGDMMEA